MDRCELKPLAWLSGPGARSWLRARQHCPVTLELSFDLNRTTELAHVCHDGVRRLANDTLIPWDVVREVAQSEHGCYTWDGHRAEPIAAYSETLQRYCSLMATDGAPTLLIAGFPMHRIKGIDPWQDAAVKWRAVGPIRGRVLDTCTGLGYTAIQATRTARAVTTVELDPTVLELARLNPWSADLFEAANIEQLIGDVARVVTEFEPASFQCIVHDPPTVELSGELYGAEFYRALHRVLKPGGRLLHYVGDPTSRHGARVLRGVMRRLQEAGFRAARVLPRAHSVVARRT